jgi:hypothetical protein
MKLGTIFPNADIGTDPAAIRDYARAVEDAGFDYLLTYVMRSVLTACRI